MKAIFPSADWLQGLKDQVNGDARYAQVARNWEGDLFFFIEPEGNLPEEITFYIDLFHGACPRAEYMADPAAHPKPAFIMRAKYNDITSILTGKLNPMTAMLTNKLRVQGSMTYMMRNVPTVLDFVRCAAEATEEIL
jgi:putative sterol carrier protein